MSTVHDSLPVAAAPRGSQAMIEVSAQREIAQVQAQIIMARRFPRDVRTALDRITMACTRPELAEVALYTYARGGTDITGPSIRMAEALAQNWGNIEFGIRELEQRPGESTMEAFAMDLETNTRQVKVFQVPHVRFTRNGGRTPLEDPRDVYEQTANQGARRLRACILGIIPGDVIEAAVRQVEVTLKTRQEATPERIKAMLERFAEYGVTKTMIERRIQRSIEAITPALLIDLAKKYNSIKDGMSSPSDWFDPDPTDGGGAPAPTTATEAVKDRLRAAAPPAPEPTPSGEPETAPEEPLATATMVKHLMVLTRKKLGDLDREARLAYFGATIGRSVNSSKDLALSEYKTLMDHLNELAEKGDGSPTSEAKTGAGNGKASGTAKPEPASGAPTAEDIAKVGEELWGPEKPEPDPAWKTLTVEQRAVRDSIVRLAASTAWVNTETKQVFAPKAIRDAFTVDPGEWVEPERLATRPNPKGILAIYHEEVEAARVKVPF